MLEKEQVNLIIPSTGVSGAEKRFLAFWLYVKRKNILNFKLTVNQKFYENCLLIEEFKDIIIYKTDIIFFDKWHKNNFLNLLQLTKYYFKNKNKYRVFHYVIFFPIFSYSQKNNTLYSFAASTFKSYSGLTKSIALVLFFINAKFIDVLDPILIRILKKRFFYKKRRFFLTSNSFVQMKNYPNVSLFEKENWFVFMGRFMDKKQVIRFAEAIPLVHDEVRKLGIHDAKFFILGKGEQLSILNDLLGKEIYNDIDVVIKHVKNPVEILSKSKVFFSVQKANNYPSKSLLEALACKNIPIVTDVGTTRMIACPEFSYYIPENFTNYEIAQQVKKILSLEEKNIIEKMNCARSFVELNCRLDTMSEYYIDLYRKMLN